MDDDDLAAYMATLTTPEDLAEVDAALAEAEGVAPQPYRATFDRLGYEPICKPRVELQLAQERGERLGESIPAPCGMCPQERFHSAAEFDVLYGGAAGPGKTKALLMGGIGDSMAYPGIRIAAFRETYDELAESLLKELEGISFAESLGAAWNGTKRELRFPNRSVMRFRYAQTEKDATRRQGGEYQRLIIDERSLMAPSVVGLLEERLRSGRADLPVLGVRSSANPGGPGHGAMKLRYIDATDHGTKIVHDEQGRTVRFIPARHGDNPYLGDDYMATLLAIKDPARRKAMLDGDWDTFVGQFFELWRHDRHVVEPFPIPTEWQRYAGVDYGYAAPWCTLWGAVDGDGRVWAHREVYETQVGQTAQAQRILAYERSAGETIRSRAADPSMWAKVGEANSNAKVYADEGCAITKANNNRLSGWARVNHYLAEAPACDLHRAAGWETCPLLHVFSTCTNLTRTLPNLGRDKARPEDVDTHGEDHAADALRYMLMEIGSGGATITTSHLRNARIPTGVSSSRRSGGTLTGVHGYAGRR